MVAALWRRVPLIPDVRFAGLAECALAFGAARLHHERQLVDRGSAMAGVAHEARVLRVGHRLHAEKEIVQVDAVHGPFVFLRVL
jgi:hypothetical protein